MISPAHPLTTLAFTMDFDFGFSSVLHARKLTNWTGYGHEFGLCYALCYAFFKALVDWGSNLFYMVMRR